VGDHILTLIAYVGIGVATGGGSGAPIPASSDPQSPSGFGAFRPDLAGLAAVACRAYKRFPEWSASDGRDE
jgi:hypothetical protein